MLIAGDLLPAIIISLYVIMIDSPVLFLLTDMSSSSGYKRLSPEIYPASPNTSSHIIKEVETIIGRYWGSIYCY